jgi:hypothetical protein
MFCKASEAEGKCNITYNLQIFKYNIIAIASRTAVQQITETEMGQSQCNNHNTAVDKVVTIDGLSLSLRTPPPTATDTAKLK